MLNINVFIKLFDYIFFFITFASVRSKSQKGLYRCENIQKGVVYTTSFFFYVAEPNFDPTFSLFL